MKTVSTSKKRISKILKSKDIDIDMDGLIIQRNSDGNLMITSPAPDGEPTHYNARTNRGGRRFVCWA